MAKKKNQQQSGASGPAQKAAAPPKPVTVKKEPVSAGKGVTTRYRQPLIIAGILLATFGCYATILGNELTNWDDLGYIISNPLIRDSSFEGIRKIFSTDNPVMGNYHPLTIMLYAFEFSYKGLEPFIYHFDSLVLHLLVTLAVFYLIKNLTKNIIVAAVTSLLFGLHPMHVESVAWAAGRKDVLYGLFFILSCNTYIYYLRATDNKKWLWYVSGIILFAISLLAKSVAVSLPVTLFLFDYIERRKFSVKMIVEKIPHFGLSLLFGLISVHAQDKIGALGSLDVSFNPLERIALGAYALCTYLWKDVLPLNLSNFYPYPLKENGALPSSYYVYLAALAAVVAAAWWFGRKSREVVFGIGFFLINIALLLQFIPVGGAIISDRYGYIPYLGLFFICGWAIARYYDRAPGSSASRMALGGILAYCLVLGYMTNERNKDWHDSISLWNDDRDKHPEAPVAYFYLGEAYDSHYQDATDPKEKKNDLDSAYYYYSKAIEHKPDYLNAITCLGELQRSIGQIDEAKATYLKALKINDKNESVYLGLGVVYSIKRQYDSAAYCFQRTLALKPGYPEAHSNYANFLDIIGNPDSSLKEFGTAISLNPEAYIPYLNRARINLVEKGKPDEAITDYNMVIRLKPELGEPYYLRSKCYLAKGNKAQALADAEQAKKLGYTQIPPEYLQSLH